MASTSSHFFRDPQAVLDDINYQFQLEPSTLIRLAEAFLEEFRLGLSSYGQPMAMMCVVSASCVLFLTGISVPRSSPASQTEQKQGKRRP